MNIDWVVLGFSFIFQWQESNQPCSMPPTSLSLSLSFPLFLFRFLPPSISLQVYPIYFLCSMGGVEIEVFTESSMSFPHNCLSAVIDRTASVVYLLFMVCGSMDHGFPHDGFWHQHRSWAKLLVVVGHARNSLVNVMKYLSAVNFLL